ncbi:MAG: Uma2 family endonuclease [Planctomycetes bacterium]|nr:Uma2 family endonuclease [Planctomycetota bacterium]
MSIMSDPLFTAAQLACLPSDRDRFELVRGEMRRMNPGNFTHGAIASRADRSVRACLPVGAGEVCAADTGFLLATNPDTVLAPDVAFVRAERCRIADPESFFPGPPDLAVEVKSPRDTRAALARKARLWLYFGCPLVLTIDPTRRTLTVWKDDAPPCQFAVTDEFRDDSVIAGLRIQVADLFPS